MSECDIQKYARKYGNSRIRHRYTELRQFECVIRNTSGFYTRSFTPFITVRLGRVDCGPGRVMIDYFVELAYIHSWKGDSKYPLISGRYEGLLLSE